MADTPLSETTGWLVVILFGAVFTAITKFASDWEAKRSGTKMSSEQYNTAGRNVGAGLTAAVIVSQWTWAATLLQSSNKGWQYGVSGPFWYASGATIQILLFAMLAIQVKIRCPKMHTMLETIHIRWGETSHKVFIFFAFMCNCIVTSMLLLGGSATIQDLTGVSKTWCCFLIPAGVLVYTYYGGLRATFLASYLHSSIIYVTLIVFGTTVYISGTTPGIGSTEIVWENLHKSSMQMRIAGGDSGKYEFTEGLLGNVGECYKTAADKAGTGTGTCYFKACATATSSDADAGKDKTKCVNQGMQVGNVSAIVDSGGKFFEEDPDAKCAEGSFCVGSYATMTSSGGLWFGIINIVGNFGTVFVDQSYWQSAIAAKPSTAVNGFLIGGMCWFAVPFFMATTFGLAGRALTAANPAFIITGGNAGAGLVPAKVITETLGSSGAFLLLMQLFMAVTSTGSAECIAVSAILTYDVYWTYLNPELKEKVVNDALIYTNAADEGKNGADVAEKLVAAGWLDAKFVVPADIAAMGTTGDEEKRLLKNALIEGQTSKSGAHLVRMSKFFTCFFGFFMGFLAVLLDNLGLNLGWVYGSMGCVIGSAVAPIAISIMSKKANGTWCTAAAVIGLVVASISWAIRANNEFDEVTVASLGGLIPTLIGNVVAILVSAVISMAGTIIAPDEEFEWEQLEAIPMVDSVLPPIAEGESKADLEAEVGRANKWALTSSVFLIIIWPAPMYLMGNVMGSGGFTIWVYCAFVWAVIAAVTIIGMPPFEMLKSPKADAAPSKP